MFGAYLGHFLDDEKRRGYDGFTANYNGFLTGLMLNVNENLALGTYGGYGNGKTEFDHLKTDIESDAFMVGLLARYNTGAFKLTGDFLYTYAENDVYRTVPFSVEPVTMNGSYNDPVLVSGL